MTPLFIRATDIEGEEHRVQVRHIVSYAPRREGSLMRMVHGPSLYLLATPEQLDQMIENAALAQERARNFPSVTT